MPDCAVHPEARGQPTAAPAPRPPRELGWVWGLLLGLCMAGRGPVAPPPRPPPPRPPLPAPFLRMTRAQLHAVNARLLAFMAHDRAPLAGTMVTVGCLYSALAVWGARRGARWAAAAVLTSAFSGFASFFLFLGFGYFDPFHAF